MSPIDAIMTELWECEKGRVLTNYVLCQEYDFPLPAKEEVMQMLEMREAEWRHSLIPVIKVLSEVGAFAAPWDTGAVADVLGYDP